MNQISTGLKELEIGFNSGVYIFWLRGQNEVQNLTGGLVWYWLGVECWFKLNVQE